MATVLTQEGTFMARVSSWGETETAKGKRVFNIDFEIIDAPYTGFNQRYTGFLGDEKSEEFICKALRACGWDDGKPLESIKNAVVQIKVRPKTSNGKTFYNVQYVNPPPTGGSGKKTPMTEQAKKDFLGRMSAANTRITVAESSTEVDPFA